MVSAVVVAAGASRRMGRDKLFLELDGIPVVVRSLLALERTPSVSEVIVVTREELFGQYEQWKNDYRLEKLSRIVAGGETRQQSVLNGIRVVSEASDYLAIHDGARPLVDPEDIEQVIRDAERHGAATLGVPVKDTVKVVNSDGTIEATPDRSTLYLTQTPQVFRRSLYLEGVAAAGRDGKDFTDDCQLAEYAGYPVHMTVGSYTNIKLTTEDDLRSAEAFLRGTEK